MLQLRLTYTAAFSWHGYFEVFAFLSN